MAVATLERPPIARETFRPPVVPVSPDASLLAMCAEFDRRSAALKAVPPEADDDVHTLAWERRQDVIGILAYLRPATDEGRRAKAVVAMAILLEVAAWERGPEWEFALGCARAEQVAA